MLFKIAFRNIFRQKRRSLITAISMAGGYALMSLALSVSDGTYNNMIDLFTKDHSGHIQVHYQNYLRKPKIHRAIPDLRQVEAELKEISGIESFAPRILTPALAYGETKSSPVSVVGINPELEGATSLLAKKVKQGNYLDSNHLMDEESGSWKAMIGFGVADALNIGLGDTLVLIGQGADGSIANDLYVVSAIVGNQTSWEKNRVFLPMAAASEFLSLYNSAHQISVLLKGPEQAQEMTQKITAQLSNKDLTVSPWQEVEEVFYKSMRSDVVSNYVTQGVIIFIVCIGILNTVFMSIVERTREFGVLKAIGTSPWMLFRLILLETAILATFSSIVGFFLALPTNYWFATQGIKLSVEMDMGGIMYDRLLGEVSVRTMLLPAIVVTLSAVAVSVFPAMRAARLSPIEAIRSR